MNRAQKEALVANLSERLAAAPLIVLADYRGVTVAEIDGVRRHLEKHGLEYQVIKNTLAGRAIAGTDKEALTEMMTGMTGFIISGEDPIAAAKVVREVVKPFKKEEKFVIKGGFFDGEVLDGANIQKVADLPGREELLSMLLRTIQEGPRQVLGVIQGPARDLVNLLKNYEHKLEDSEGGE